MIDMDQIWTFYLLNICMTHRSNNYCTHVLKKNNFCTSMLICGMASVYMSGKLWFIHGYVYHVHFLVLLSSAYVLISYNFISSWLSIVKHELVALTCHLKPKTVDWRKTICNIRLWSVTSHSNLCIPYADIHSLSLATLFLLDV